MQALKKVRPGTISMTGRLRYACVLLFLAWAWCFPAIVSAQSERILDYHSDIELREDATLFVRETIRVVSQGAQIRHGIYRDFPTRYTDSLGTRYIVGFDVLAATRDGAPEEFRVEDRSNGKRIYLGRASYLLPPGEHTYTITYTTDRQLGYFPDHDELFWNVTGNGWIFPIEHASATVRMPAAIPAGAVRLGGYTGPQGSLAHDLRYRADESGGFDFAASHMLPANQGLTILLMWPKGYVHEPTKQEKLAYFFQDNRDLLIGGGGIALILLYYVSMWFLAGRDPARGAIVTLYEPPAGFSPAATRYLARMGYDNKTLACAVLDMAVKGYLQIQEQAGSYTLYRAKADGSVLSPDEKTAADILLDGRNEIWLHNENHTTIHTAISALKKWLKTAEERVYFVTNAGYMIPAVVISAGVVGWMVASQGAPKIFIAAFATLWLTIWSIAVAGLILAAVHAWAAAFSGGRLAAGLTGKAIVITLFALPFLGGEALGLFFLTMASSIFVVATILAAVALHILFHYLLKAPTRAGRSVLDKIEGFKRFLSAVDGDRMNRMMPVDRTPEVFEKYLPYAMALDVEKAWAEKFADVLNSAGQAGASGYSPAWYAGPGWSNFGAAGFASSLGSSFANAISSSATAPGSSGGGGGGSGGGGGGGGGGGW
jgi:uncharacterized membrane protein YgcG